MAESIIKNPKAISGDAEFEIQLVQRVNNAYILCYNDPNIKYSKPVSLVSIKTSEGTPKDLTTYFTFDSTNTEVVAYSTNSNVGVYVGKTLILKLHFGA